MTASIIPLRTPQPEPTDARPSRQPSALERDPVRFNAFLAEYEMQLQVIAAELRHD